MNEDRKFLTQRLGYFRNKAKLSTRELSQRMGYSSGYISKFELGLINIPTESLLDALKIMEVPVEQFFSKNPDEYNQNAQLVEDFGALSSNNKELIIKLIKALK